MDQHTLFKIAKMCGKFGSAHDGEILSAAKMAHKLVKETKLTWDDVLLKNIQVSAPPPPPSGNEPISDKEKVSFCLERMDFLRDKEIDFLESIRERLMLYGRELTEKQAKWLRNIYERLA